MATKNYKNKSQITKRTFITILSILIIILAILYFYKWHQIKEQEKYLTSYLIESNTISLEMNDIAEIDSVLSETGSYYFIYIGYTKDEKVYKLEKELKPIIDEYSLHNNFYYLNVTNIKDKNKNYKQDIAKKLNIPENKISQVPLILYFKGGQLMQDGVTTPKEFKQLLEQQNVDKM